MAAELILRNGTIRTFDPDLAVAQALVIEKGRIIFVGGNIQASGYKGIGTRVIDLAGKALLPGFIDAHQHQLYMGLEKLQVDTSPRAVKSIPEIVNKVRHQASVTPSLTWIEGRGYHDGRLAEQRNPTRFDLDQATEDHPVVITRVCGHVMSVNSLALRIAGIQRHTPDPPGGSIERNPLTGEPTGVLRETAMAFIRRVIPPKDTKSLRTAILEAATRNLRHGITTVWEPSIEPDQLEVYKELESEHALPLRVIMAHKKVLRNGDEVSLPKPFNKGMLSLVAVKLFQDGGFGGATAALTEPYADQKDVRGQLVWDQAELNQRAKEIQAAGLRISIHAIGDAAIHMALQAIEEALDGTHHIDHRHRIEHGGLPIPPLPDRIARLGVVVVSQPAFLWFDGDVYMDRVGSARSKWLYPLKTLIEHQAAVAGSSDGPVVPDINPLLGAFAAVTRLSQAGRPVAPAEALDIGEALALYTSRAAYACGEEQFIGSITVGKAADFVVLAADPFSVPIEVLPKIPVESVMVTGREVDLSL